MTTQPTVTVHLMRHGEVHNPERIVYGRLPHYALSEKGQQMVRMSAQEFAQRAQDGAKIVHLVCSPLLRTRESAAPITELLSLEAHADQRVIEADNYFEGEHVTRQGLLRNRKHWGKLYNPLRPSWGEPYLDQVKRMASAIQDAARTAYDKGGEGAQAIIVSHQLPIWVTRLGLEGRMLQHDPRTRQCNLASITSLDFKSTDFDHEMPQVSGYSEPASPLYGGVIQLPGS